MMMRESSKTIDVVLAPLEEFRAAHDSFQQTVRWIQNGNPAIALPHPKEDFNEQLADFTKWRASLSLAGEPSHEEVITYRIEHFLSPLFDALLTWSASLANGTEHTKKDVTTQAEAERLATLVLEHTKMSLNRMKSGPLQHIVAERVISMERGLRREVAGGLTMQ
ncbi:MAG: hypothetical protein WAX38_01840 [Minisyncoccia bacterium]